MLGWLFRNANKVWFVALHLAVIAVFLVPFAWESVWLGITLYYIRMFGLTAGYHRLLSHRAFGCPRWVQFIFAWLGCAALQRGPVWWCARHREHHKFSDTDDDPHSPLAHGVWEAHVGWVLTDHPRDKDVSRVKDLMKCRELRLLDALHWIPGILLIPLCYWIGGWTGVVYGFVLSTVTLYHGTFMVNSVCHLFGYRNYDTGDGSRNNWLVALLFTMGEGWHNNHHHRQGRAKQGVKWWELDLTYCMLWAFSLIGLVRGLRKPQRELEPAEDASG